MMLSDPWAVKTSALKPPLRIPVVRGGPWEWGGRRWELWRNGKDINRCNTKIRARAEWWEWQGTSATWYKSVVLEPGDEVHAPKNCAELPETDGSVIFYWKDEEAAKQLRCARCEGVITPGLAHYYRNGQWYHATCDHVEPKQPDIQVGDWVERIVSAAPCLGCVGQVENIGAHGYLHLHRCRDSNGRLCGSCGGSPEDYKRIPSLRAPEGVTLKYVTAEEYADDYCSVGELPGECWSVRRAGCIRGEGHSYQVWAADANHTLQRAKSGETWLVCPPRDSKLYPKEKS